MDLGIRGKRALVCASSKGLGLGCARALAEAGVHLVLNALGGLKKHAPYYWTLQDFLRQDLVILGYLATQELSVQASLETGEIPASGVFYDVWRLFMERYGHKVMLFPDGLKLMRRGNAYEVYDVRRDPKEETNLWDRLGEDGPRREALLEAYLQVHSERDDIDPREVDGASSRWAH